MNETDTEEKVIQPEQVILNLTRSQLNNAIRKGHIKEKRDPLTTGLIVTSRMIPLGETVRVSGECYVVHPGSLEEMEIKLKQLGQTRRDFFSRQEKRKVMREVEKFLARGVKK